MTAPRDEKIHVGEGKETYLATLYGRALDNRAADPILGDGYADDAVRRIDFDFASLKLPQGASISLPVRAKHLDGWARQFLAAHPASTVLHLGCGLDSRVFRIDPPAAVRWYDVDLPDVIELRRRLFRSRAVTPAGDSADGHGAGSYALVATSVADARWLDEVPTDRPVLVVAEGLVQYLSEAEGIALFRRVVERFPSGELIFDAYSPMMNRLVSRLSTVRGAHVRLGWGIGDPHALEVSVPGLRLVDAVPFLTMSELVARTTHSRAQAVVYGAIGRSGYVQRAVRHLRYEF